MVSFTIERGESTISIVSTMIKKYPDLVNIVLSFLEIRRIITNIDPLRRQSAISGSVTLIITIFGFFSTIYFAHSVGASVLGLYFLFIAYFTLFTLIGDAGFTGAVIKRISEGKDYHEFLSAFLVIRIVLLFMSLIILVAVYPHLTNFQGQDILLLTAIALIFGMFSDWAIVGVYGLGKIGFSQMSILLNTVIRLVLQIIAIFLGMGIFGLLGGFILGTISGTVLNLYFLEFRFARFTVNHLRSLSTYAIWSFFSSAGLLIFSYADTILIGLFLNTAEVGIYRTSLNLTALPTSAVLAFQFVLFPKISNWWTNGNLGSIQSSVRTSIYYSLALAIPSCVGGWILGDTLLYFLYGSSFSSGYVTLSILLFVQIINVFMVLFTMTLNALNHPHEVFRVTLISASITIILDLLLIPVIGINGAAVAVLCSFFVNAFLMKYMISKIIPIPLNLNALDKILVASACMAGFLLVYRYLVPMNTVFLAIMAVLLGCLVYGLILLRLDKSIYLEIKKLLEECGIYPA